jgi:hypothetical protein
MTNRGSVALSTTSQLRSASNARTAALSEASTRAAVKRASPTAATAFSARETSWSATTTASAKARRAMIVVMAPPTRRRLVDPLADA